MTTTGQVQSNGKATLAALQQEEFKLKDVVEDMFLVLTEKEKDVIIKRFSLDNKPRQTLDKIGRHYSVTRERIRQIENIALAKLRRTVSNTKLRLINRLAKEIITQEGGVMVESEIINRILQHVYTDSKLDGMIIALSLNCDVELKKVPRTNTSETFWMLKELSLSDVRKITEAGLNVLKKHGDVMTDDQLISAVQNLSLFKNKTISNKLIVSCLSTDKRAKKLDGKWGLMEWRHVNPRSIRDKAEIVLEKVKKPLHFVEIANRISEIGFDKKVVTVQAVHNELIRYDQFVLVGRGLYALSKWGYEPGTVSDVIEKLLEKNGPMSKKQIIKEVLEQRDVKVGTISLNLQKNPGFVRVGRAVYNLGKKK
jgi:DNA-directed RNA polymerase delta subunit